MKNIYRFTGIALVVGALTITPAAADATGQSTQHPPSGTTTKGGSDGPAAGKPTGQASGELKAADRTFLLDAIEGNKAEAELARMATDKASSATVKELAQMIQQDHTSANTKLKSLAGNIVPSNTDPAPKSAHKALQDRLSKLEGAAFDKAYAAEMVKEHEKDIAKYEKASSQLHNSALKSYATETLPLLKQHLEKARQASNVRGTH